MGYYKDQYIRELEEEWARLEEMGVSPDKAYAQAGENVYNRHREKLRLHPTEQALDRTR
jgi:hypothetical protein